MQYLNTYQLFESLEITEWSDIKDLINVVEDEFNFEFKQFKVTNDSSVGGFSSSPLDDSCFFGENIKIIIAREK